MHRHTHRSQWWREFGREGLSPSKKQILQYTQTHMFCSKQTTSAQTQYVTISEIQSHAANCCAVLQQNPPSAICRGLEVHVQTFMRWQACVPVVLFSLCFKCISMRVSTDSLPLTTNVYSIHKDQMYLYSKMFHAPFHRSFYSPYVTLSPWLPDWLIGQLRQWKNSPRVCLRYTHMSAHTSVWPMHVRCLLIFVCEKKTAVRTDYLVKKHIL